MNAPVLQKETQSNSGNSFSPDVHPETQSLHVSPIVDPAMKSQSHFGNAAIVRAGSALNHPKGLSNSMAGRLLDSTSENTGSQEPDQIPAKAGKSDSKSSSPTSGASKQSHRAPVLPKVDQGSSSPKAAQTHEILDQPASQQTTSGTTSESTFSSFTQSSATNIATHLGSVGERIGKLFTTDRRDLVESAPSVCVLIHGDEAAEKLATNAGPAEVRALPTAEGVALEPAKDTPNLSANETSVPSQPADNSVNTNVGAAPQFRAGGEADANRMSPVVGKAQSTAYSASQSIADEIAANSSGNKLVPTAVDRQERIEMAESTATASDEPSTEMLEYVQTDVGGDVRAIADADFAPLLEFSLAGPRQQVQQAAFQRDADRQQAYDEAQNEADIASSEAQAQQQQAITDGRAQIDVEKKRGLVESEQKLAAFDAEVKTRHATSRSEIGKKIGDEQVKADAAISDAEVDARAKQAQAKKDADKEIKNAQGSKPKEEKNLWGKLTSWFKKAINKWKNALKSAVDKVFKIAKSAVKAVFDAAKKLATGIIRSLRHAVVGMIKVFAAGLKVLVNGLLIFFPKLRARVNEAIDSVVETAVAVVDKVAKALEGKVVALIDKVQSVVTRIVEFYEDSCGDSDCDCRGVIDWPVHGCRHDLVYGCV